MSLVSSADTRRAVLVAMMCVPALAGAAPTIRAQDAATRFFIVQVDDSTFAFPLGTHAWVKRGMRGIAVDARRRDALIARFEVMAVHDGQARALVTGQTTALSMDHTALVMRPHAAWYRRRDFWIGLGLGGAAGAVIAKNR